MVSVPNSTVSVFSAFSRNHSCTPTRYHCRTPVMVTVEVVVVAVHTKTVLQDGQGQRSQMAVTPWMRSRYCSYALRLT